MEGIEVIFMALGLVFGISGTLIAKKARKKSSYPLLYTSGALAVLTLAAFIAAAIFVFFVK
jgi:high-affinity Fe2+/Pb2+ permease